MSFHNYQKSICFTGISLKLTKGDSSLKDTFES